MDLRTDLFVTFLAGVASAAGFAYLIWRSAGKPPAN